ncbi:MAG: hypothetical protein ACR2N6_09065 [Miltoncostaeaceae bacterium]
MSALASMSPRAEKTIRLVTACAVATGLGIPAVVLDSEALGFAAVGIIAAAILAGPVIERVRSRDEAAA